MTINMRLEHEIPHYAFTLCFSQGSGFIRNDMSIFEGGEEGEAAIRTIIYFNRMSFYESPLLPLPVFTRYSAVIPSASEGSHFPILNDNSVVTFFQNVSEGSQLSVLNDN
jgi:hypothetical protein